MTSTKILILESDLLLSAGVKNLLVGLSKVQIQEVKYSNMEELSKAINNFQPDIILIDKTNMPVNAEKILNFLQEKSKVKIIFINPENNQIETYDKHQISVTELSDFLAMLYGG